MKAQLQAALIALREPSTYAGIAALCSIAAPILAPLLPPVASTIAAVGAAAGIAAIRLRESAPRS